MKSDRGKRKRTRLGRVKQKYATVLLSDWYFSSLSAISFGSARCLPAPACAPTNAVGRVWASLPTLRPCTGSQRDQTSVWGSSARHTLLPSSFETFNNRLGKGWRTFWCFPKLSDLKTEVVTLFFFLFFLPQIRLYPPQCRAVPNWTCVQPLVKYLEVKMDLNFKTDRKTNWNFKISNFFYLWHQLISEVKWLQLSFI